MLPGQRLPLVTRPVAAITRPSLAATPWMAGLLAGLRERVGAPYPSNAL